MRTKLFCCTLALVMLLWSGRGLHQGIRAQQPHDPAQAERKTVETPGGFPRLGGARTILQVQLEMLDLQKRQLEDEAREQIRQLEEQTREQIEQWKNDLARQVEQLRRQTKRQADQTLRTAKWQGEQLEAQKRLLEAQVLSAMTTGQPMPGIQGKPPAEGLKARSGPGSAEERLDRILDRLERLEKRLEKKRLEKAEKGSR